MQEDGPAAALARMRELNKEGKLSLKTVAEKLGKKPEALLGLYLYGSRLWGTATGSSDYDFLVVLKKSDKDCQTIHSGNIDCLVFSEKEFLSRLAAHAFLCVMVTCWLPDEWVWKRYPVKNVSLKPDVLQAAILSEVERDWGVAAKRRAKGLKDAANKIEMHAIRMLRVAKQLRDGAEKPDLACAVDVWQYLKDDYAGTLAEPYLAELKASLL